MQAFDVVVVARLDPELPPKPTSRGAFIRSLNGAGFDVAWPTPNTVHARGTVEGINSEAGQLVEREVKSTIERCAEGAEIALLPEGISVKAEPRV